MSDLKISNETLLKPARLAVKRPGLDGQPILRLNHCYIELDAVASEAWKILSGDQAPLSFRKAVDELHSRLSLSPGDARTKMLIVITHLVPLGFLSLTDPC